MRTTAQTTYVGGAAALAGEAVVHLQQYASLFREVSWIGPLFLANAIACAAVLAGMAYRRTRESAALTGVVISAVAVGSLVVSYGQGLFGWREAGFRPVIELTLIFEVAAVVLLSAALAATAASATRSALPRTGARVIR